MSFSLTQKRFRMVQLLQTHTWETAVFMSKINLYFVSVLNALDRRVAWLLPTHHTHPPIVTLIADDWTGRFFFSLCFSFSSSLPRGSFCFDWSSQRFLCFLGSYFRAYRLDKASQCLACALKQFCIASGRKWDSPNMQTHKLATVMSARSRYCLFLIKLLLKPEKIKKYNWYQLVYNLLDSERMSQNSLIVCGEIMWFMLLLML